MSPSLHTAGRRPVIGISAGILHEDPARRAFNGRKLYYVEYSLSDWLFRCGALAYVLPVPAKDSPIDVSDLVEPLDGLVLQGGVDISPLNYGETARNEEWVGDPVRDAYEIELIQQCIALNKPVLGICRGHQLINVALGGSLYQDIPTQLPSDVVHFDRPLYEKCLHEIEFEPDSHLATIYPGMNRARVISVHHQAVKLLGTGLQIEARSPTDGLVEGIRLAKAHPLDPYVVGVQWHPEFQNPADTGLLDPRPLVTDFLAAVSARRR